MSDQTFIWITRWEDFQHYAPERDRAPGWIKAYTKQLSDDRYLNLTSAQRALLHDLRCEFARAHGELTNDTRRIAQRIGLRVTNGNLEALNHAGFIEFLSREALDLALDKFYASRARDRAHQREVEKDGEQEQDTPEGPSAEDKVQVQVKTPNHDAREPDEDIDLGPPTNGTPTRIGLEPVFQTISAQLRDKDSDFHA
jgi:hypothetical protein